MRFLNSDRIRRLKEIADRLPEDKIDHNTRRNLGSVNFLPDKDDRDFVRRVLNTRFRTLRRYAIGGMPREEVLWHIDVVRNEHATEKGDADNAGRGLSLAEAAKYMTEKTGKKWDRARVSRELKTGKIQKAGKYLTTADLDKRVKELRLRSARPSGTSSNKTMGKCDKCGKVAKKRNVAHDPDRKMYCGQCFGAYATR